jgi:hypothetical protein
MNQELDKALNFEWMPDKLKDYIYGKYKLDSIYLKKLGAIDEDYFWIVVVYDSELSERYYDSYSEFEKSLNRNIFENFPNINQGEMRLQNKIGLFIEVFDQKQVMELMGYHEIDT